MFYSVFTFSRVLEGKSKLEWGPDHFSFVGVDFLMCEFFDGVCFFGFSPGVGDV